MRRLGDIYACEYERAPAGEKKESLASFAADSSRCYLGSRVVFAKFSVTRIHPRKSRDFPDSHRARGDNNRTTGRLRFELVTSELGKFGRHHLGTTSCHLCASSRLHSLRYVPSPCRIRLPPTARSPRRSSWFTSES